MTGLVLSPVLWSHSSSHSFGFTTGNVDFLLQGWFLKIRHLLSNFFATSAPRAQGGVRGLKFWRKKNQTTNQDPKLDYLGGLIGSKSLLKNEGQFGIHSPPHPTPFREGGRRKKVEWIQKSKRWMSGFGWGLGREGG